jgi:hypothetical protein
MASDRPALVTALFWLGRFLGWLCVLAGLPLVIVLALCAQVTPKLTHTTSQTTFFDVPSFCSFPRVVPFRRRCVLTRTDHLHLTKRSCPVRISATPTGGAPMER